MGDESAVCGRFLDYWQTNGGLARNGLPLSGEFTEVLEDGQPYTVQYFERVRLEYHPENAPPYDVLVGQFGRRVLREAYIRALGATYEQATAPVPGEGPYYFPQTGHTIAARFRDYWQANGGLAQFGYPITEERWDSTASSDGSLCCVTQYFERARFEYHPENAGTPYVIELGQFGRGILEANALLEGDFGAIYRASDPARAALGRPQASAESSRGATQAFEGGRMFWVEREARGLRPIIYALCGGESSGEVLGQHQSAFFPDTWAEGQELGGGRRRSRGCTTRSGASARFVATFRRCGSASATRAPPARPASPSRSSASTAGSCC